MPRRVSPLLLLPVIALVALGVSWLLLGEEEARPEADPGLLTARDPGEPAKTDRPTLEPTGPAEAPQEGTKTKRGGDGPADPAQADPRAGPKPRAAPAPAYQLAGRVRDAGGVPISGAEISPHRSRNSVRSDHRGHFVLSVPEQSGLILVRAGGFVSRRVPVSKRQRRLVVVLRKSRRLIGNVVQKADFSPIRYVQILAQSNHWRERKTTDTLGRFSFETPMSEVWMLVHKNEWVTRVWREGDPPTIELERGRAIKGRTVGRARRGWPRPMQAHVFLVGADQRTTIHRTRTTNQGQFAFKGGISAKEEFALFAFSYRFATPLEPVWFEAGRQGGTVTMLERGSVTLTNSEGAGYIYPAALDVPLGLAANPNTSRRRGRRSPVTFDHMAAGKYQFRRQGRNVGGVFRVEPGRVTYLDWKKPAAFRVGRRKRTRRPEEKEQANRVARIDVRVLDGKGKPVAVAEVTATGSGTVTKHSDPNGDAEFELEDQAEWTFRARLTGRVLVAPVTRLAGGARRIDLRLVRPQTLKGKIKPPAAVGLKLHQAGASDDATPLRTLTSDAQGAFQVAGLAPGNYVLEVTPAGAQESQRVEVELPLEGELLIELE